MSLRTIMDARALVQNGKFEEAQRLLPHRILAASNEFKAILVNGSAPPVPHSIVYLVDHMFSWLSYDKEFKILKSRLGNEYQSASILEKLVNIELSYNRNTDRIEIVKEEDKIIIELRGNLLRNGN